MGHFYNCLLCVLQYQTARTEVSMPCIKQKTFFPQWKIIPIIEILIFGMFQKMQSF